MENTYGIGVTNRYALFLDDESDPLETLKLKEQEKELKKKSKIAEKENKGKTEQPVKGKTTTAVPKKSVKEITANKPQDNKREDNKLNHQRPNTEGKPERGDRDRPFNKFGNNENREERNNRRNREDRTINGSAENRERDREDRPPRRENAAGGENNFENRRGGRPAVNKPGNGPKGPRRPFEDRRGKREFDRQSGSDKTGIKPIDKRDGAGAHNWGSHKDVIEEAADKPTTEADPNWGESERIENPTAPEQNKEETEAESAPVEEEPKELTLDEWKAQRATRSKPQYNIRKAGEGEDLSQWKKMYELRKKENEEESDDEDYDVTAEYPQRVGRQKHILDIDIQFNDARRAGGGRGPRGPRPGGPGGVPGAGGPRGPRNNARGNVEGRNGPSGERSEGGARRYRDSDQNDDRNENRRAPKVDDERDFPSLG